MFAEYVGVMAGQGGPGAAAAQASWCLTKAADATCPGQPAVGLQGTWPSVSMDLDVHVAVVCT